MENWKPLKLDQLPKIKIMYIYLEVTMYKIMKSASNAEMKDIS